MAENLQEKKHAPTARRRKKAREQGEVAKSSDLSSAGLLLAAIGSLWFLGGRMASHLALAMVESFSSPTIAGFDVATASNSIARLGLTLLYAAAPLLLTMMGAAVLVNLSQTGLVFAPGRAAPSLNHINPLSGAGRIFSLHSVGRVGFGIFKLVVVLVVSYFAIGHYSNRVLNLGSMSLPQIAQTLFDSVLGTCLWIGGALFGLAVIDFGVQRWRFEQRLKMTDEELREELKEIEGDQAMTEHRRELQQKLSKQRIAPSRTINGAGQGSGLI